MDAVECGTILEYRSARLSLIFCELEACLAIKETCLEQKTFTKYEDPDFKYLYHTHSSWNGGGSIPFRPDTSKFHCII